MSAGACGLGISIFERGRKKLKLLLGLAEKHALFASGAIECLLCGSLQNVRDFARVLVFGDYLRLRYLRLGFRFSVIDGSDVNYLFLFQKFKHNRIGETRHFRFSEIQFSDVIIFRVFTDLAQSLFDSIHKSLAQALLSQLVPFTGF